MTEPVTDADLSPPERFEGDAQIDPDAPEPPQRGERQWHVIAAISVGGVLGSEARLGVGELLPHGAAGFPWSTVSINALGCLLLGVLMSVIGRLHSPHRLLRPLLGIGVLGGFTTFSTFAVDTERLLHLHRPGAALEYVLCTVVFAALALAVGTYATDRVNDAIATRQKPQTSAMVV